MSHNDVHASLNAWQGFLSTICQYSTRISWFVCHLSLFTSQTRPVLLLFLLFSPLLWIYGLCQRIYGLCQRISLIRVFPSSRMSLKWAWLNESKERTAALIKIKQYRLGSEFLEILKTSRFSLPVIRLFFFCPPCNHRGKAVVPDLDMYSARGCKVSSRSTLGDRLLY